LPYAERLATLRARGVAVWDVLAAGEREGSLDSSIVGSSIVVNDFNGFFAGHREIRAICFNGKTAAGLYRRKVLPALERASADIATQVLPSTSPAYATLRFEQKLERWSAALRPLVAVHEN
jgi:hypoxanthine-DNA glycosylase